MCSIYSGVWISRITRDSKINSTYQNFYLTEFVCISFNIVGTKKTIRLIQNFQLSKFYISGLYCTSTVVEVLFSQHMFALVCMCVFVFVRMHMCFLCVCTTVRACS